MLQRRQETLRKLSEKNGLASVSERVWRLRWSAKRLPSVCKSPMTLTTAKWMKSRPKLKRLECKGKDS